MKFVLMAAAGLAELTPEEEREFMETLFFWRYGGIALLLLFFCLIVVIVVFFRVLRDS